VKVEALPDAEAVARAGAAFTAAEARAATRRLRGGGESRTMPRLGDVSAIQGELIRGTL
jgi:hypothetical protein